MRKILRIFNKAIKLVAYILVFAFCLLGLSRLVAELLARPRIFKPTDAPKERVAIVFGAGLNRDGLPSAVLQDRVAVAAELYFNGRVEKLLMSGDNRFLDYNEPGAMARYAISLGVPSDAIVLDYAGRRTYDTVYRAKAIFGLEQALLVTQEFHLPRALLISRGLGLEASGVIADRRPYQAATMNYWALRETIATLAAIWDVWIGRPEPVLGQKEPIF